MVGKWAVLRVKRRTHERDADVRIRKFPCTPYRYLDLLEGLENGGVVVAAYKGEPALLCDQRMQKIFRQDPCLTEPSKVLD